MLDEGFAHRLHGLGRIESRFHDGAGEDRDGHGARDMPRPAMSRVRWPA